MAKFDIKMVMQQQNKSAVIKSMADDNKNKVLRIPYRQIDMDKYKIYEIDADEVKELALSISTIGLEQNLVVKETEEQGKYIVVTGHKRLSAIKYIFENNLEVSPSVKKELEMVNCIVIPKDEDDLITKFRMHETNQQQRKGFLINEIEDYLKTVEEARKRGLEVNGQKIKGTSRALLNTRFGMSEAMAKKYIKIIKDGDQELKSKVDNGDLSVNAAYEILQGKKEILTEVKDEKKETEKQEKQYEMSDFIKGISKQYNGILKLIDVADLNFDIFHVTDDFGEPIDKKVFELLEETKEKLYEIITVTTNAEQGKN